MDFELVLLTRESHGRWQCANSTPFPFGAYDVITVGLQKLIDANNDDIVIHGDTVAYGTGIYQADFLVVQVLSHKLRVVLDAVEKGREYPPESEGPNQWVEQQSVFKTIAATEKEPGSITEIMTLNVAGKKVTLERDFVWEKDSGRYKPTFWSRPGS